MMALLALVRTDLVLYFSNRRAVLMSIVAPILIAAFFGSLFDNVKGERGKIPIAITDLDKSSISADVVAGLRTESSLDIVELDEAPALASVKAGKHQASVVIPAGFGRATGRALFGVAAKPEIVLHYDPSQSMVLPLIRGLLAQQVMTVVSQSAFGSNGSMLTELREQLSTDPRAVPAVREELVAMFDSIARVQARNSSSSATPGQNSAAGAGLSVPFSTREQAARARAGAPYNSYAHSFAGMGVQFILMMGVDMAVGLLLMRRLGLWQRLRAAPLSRARLLSSKAMSSSLIAIFVFSVIYAVAILAFGVRIDGSWIGFAGVLVSFALLTATFGLLIAALGKTPEASRGLAILGTLLMVMLGGAWVPSFVFPLWLQKLSLFVPTRWAIDGLDAMTWRGQTFDAALGPILVMLGFSAAFAAIAIARFRWEE